VGAAPTASRTPTDAPRPQPLRRQARGERRIAQLLEAAGQVLADSGFAAATTNAIAARAGVSPGTLYQYFPNKEAIVAALADQGAQDLDELLTPLTELDPHTASIEQALTPHWIPSSGTAAPIRPAWSSSSARTRRAT
jgi:AcrR family transcriptional regulator